MEPGGGDARKELGGCHAFDLGQIELTVESESDSEVHPPPSFFPCLLHKNGQRCAPRPSPSSGLSLSSPLPLSRPFNVQSLHPFYFLFRYCNFVLTIGISLKP